MQLLPALPGSIMIVYNEEGEIANVVPIVAWVYIQANRVDPIFPIGVSVSPLSIFFLPDNEAGRYVHPHTGECLDDESECVDFMREFADQWSKRGIDAPRDESEEPAPGPTEKWAEGVLANPEFADLKGPDTRPLHFGAKTFKQQSFWHWPDSNCVFAIPGETALPSDPRVIKITGDEYKQIKLDGADVIDPHNGEVISKIVEEAPAKPRRDVSDAI